VLPEVTVIHDAWVEAVQEHSRATATFMVALPPAGSKEGAELVTDAWHRELVGDVTAATFVLAELPQAASKGGRRTAMVHCRPDRTGCTARCDAHFSPAPTSTVQRSGIVTLPTARIAESHGNPPVLSRPRIRGPSPLGIRDARIGRF
jgi:hypothetical protein